MAKRKRIEGEDIELTLIGKSSAGAAAGASASARVVAKRVKVEKLSGKRGREDDVEDSDDEDGHIAKYHNDAQDQIPNGATTDEAATDSASLGSSSYVTQSSDEEMTSDSDCEGESEMGTEGNGYEADGEGRAGAGAGAGSGANESAVQMMMSPIPRPYEDAPFRNYRDHHDFESPDSLAVSATPGTAESLEGIRFANHVGISPIRLDMGGLNLGNLGIAAEEENYESFYGLTAVGLVVALGAIAADLCG